MDGLRSSYARREATAKNPVHFLLCLHWCHIERNRSLVSMPTIPYLCGSKTQADGMRSAAGAMEAAGG
jgi:hypothetical protein